MVTNCLFVFECGGSLIAARPPLVDLLPPAPVPEEARAPLPLPLACPAALCAILRLAADDSHARHKKKLLSLRMPRLPGALGLSGAWEGVQTHATTLVRREVVPVKIDTR